MNTIHHRLRKILAPLSLLLLLGPLGDQARADLVISNWTMTDQEITFDISGTIDADADIGPEVSDTLIIGVTGNKDWVLNFFDNGSVTNHAGATRNLAGPRCNPGGGIHSSTVQLISSDWEPFAPGDVIDASVVITGEVGDLNPANLVKENLIVSAGFSVGGDAASVPQALHQVGAYEISVTPDTAPPTIKILTKKKLKTPRPRHRIVGLAQDNDEVARVEVKAGGKGWRKARLKSSGRWTFSTPRLKSGNNIFKVRASDASGNRSRITPVKATGL